MYIKDSHVKGFARMMKISQHLELKQQLTPQQVILSTLLQMPVLALEQKLKTEMELNPLLEEDIDLDQEEPEEEMSADDEAEDTESFEEEEDVLDYDSVEEDVSWEDLIHDESQYDYVPRQSGGEEEEYERPDAYKPSVYEHLINQLHEAVEDEEEFRIGEYLIYNIKEDGYLDPELDLTMVAQVFQTTVEKVEKVLRKIQGFDPVGIGSRNLQECLLVQLEEMEETWVRNVAIEIIKNYWEDFANKRYEKLMADLNLDEEVFKEIIDLITSLNPKPGEAYFDTRLNYIVPDFIVEKVDGKFIVTLNEGDLPLLRISPYYLRLLQNGKGVGSEVKSYIRKKLEAARWFLNAIQQRKNTMLKVMNAIVEKQYDFFDKGPDYLKPMIMKDIADEIGMDISTVSRVVNGKYVQTEHGVFELRSFFTEGIQTADGEEVSTQKVKNRIKELIEKEYDLNGKPFSDQELVDILNKEGFQIARRTVAKYREQLGIPVARLRKKL